MPEKKCPQCGSSFMCDIENGAVSCWCFDLPHVIPLDSITDNPSTAKGCLCPQCLQERIKTLTHPQTTKRLD